MTAQLRNNLNQLQRYAAELKKAVASHVAVGLPAEKIGGKVYGGGATVAMIGAVHEYGYEDIPERSFLRVPFAMKKDELDSFIGNQFAKVLEGRSADKALNLVGLKASEISKEAFKTAGFGTWPALKPETIAAKGSSAILMDTRVLNNSITWAVR